MVGRVRQEATTAQREGMRHRPRPSALVRRKATQPILTAMPPNHESLMASITKRPNGDRWIQFRDREKKHRTIQLGNATDDYCSRIRTLIEQLNAANKNETPISNDLALWLTTIDNALHRKLSNVGLCPPRSATA